MRRGIGWRIVLASAVCVMGIVLSACLALREGRPGDSVADGSTISSDAGVGAQDAPIPRMELEVAKAEDRLEGVFDGIGTGELKGYLVVRNTSPDALDLHVRFSHQDANREELGMHIDTFEAVAPGASALLYDATRDSGVARVGYDLTISKADASYRPIGDGVTVNYGSAHELTANMNYATFQSFVIDNQTVGSQYYTVKEGSTVITLPATVINSLSAGKHTVQIKSLIGTASGSFTVASKSSGTFSGTVSGPKTGDESNVGLWCAVAVISLAGISVIATHLIRSRKKKNNH